MLSIKNTSFSLSKITIISLIFRKVIPETFMYPKSGHGSFGVVKCFVSS